MWGKQGISRESFSSPRLAICACLVRNLAWLMKWGVTVVISQKKTSKTTSRHQNIVEYISGKSFLFIFIDMKEKVDSTLFSVRRFQYFISHTKSLFFKGRLLRDTGGSSTIKDHAWPMVCKLLYTLFLVTWVWVSCGFAGYLLHTKQAFPFSHALRIPRICSSNETYKLRCNEQTKYLNRRGYNIGFLNQKSVNTITRTDALKSSDAITDSPTRIPLVAGYNPTLPSISSIFPKYIHTLSSFQRCATVFKSIPLVPFRSTNKPKSAIHGLSFSSRLML